METDEAAGIGICWGYEVRVTNFVTYALLRFCKKRTNYGLGYWIQHKVQAAYEKRNADEGCLRVYGSLIEPVPEMRPPPLRIVALKFESRLRIGPSEGSDEVPVQQEICDTDWIRRNYENLGLRIVWCNRPGHRQF